MNTSHIRKYCSLTPILFAQHYSRTNLPGEVRCARRPHSVFLKRVASPLRWLTGSLALFVVLASTAQAGRYELEKGKGVEVCEAYEKNLNSFKPKMPMTCLRKLNPELKDFKKPGWVRLADVLNRVRFGADVDKFLWERDANPVYHFSSTEWVKWKGTKEQYAQAWESYKIERNRGLRALSRYVAEIDIDQDGTPEPVYFEQDCGSSYGTPLLVLTPDYHDIDRVKTALVMRHPSRKEAGWKEFRAAKDSDGKLLPEWAKTGYIVQNPDSLHDAYYDVFQYKSKTYYDLWWANHPDYQNKPDYIAGRLRVFIAEKSHANEICTYRFELNDR